MAAERTLSLLDYSPAATAAPTRSRRDLVFLLLALPAIVALFVPFAADVTPVAVVAVLRQAPWWRGSDLAIVMVVLMAVPLFVPIAALALRVRKLLSGVTTRRERLAYWVAAAVAAGAVVAVVALVVWHWKEVRVRDRWACAMTMSVLGCGACLLGSARRDNIASTTDVPAVAMLTPYVAGAALDLLVFRDDRQAGWYLTAFSATAAFAELILIARPVYGRRPAGR